MCFLGIIVSLPSLDLFPSRTISTIILSSHSLDKTRGHISNFILSSGNPAFLRLSSGGLDIFLVLVFILLVVPRRYLQVLGDYLVNY